MTKSKKALANKAHGFQPGHAPHPRGGRPKGAKNKFPKTITEKIVAGIAASDKSVGDGIEGYAKFLADNHPQATASLISKLVVRGGEDSSDVAGFHLPPQINILMVPSACFLTEAQIAAVKQGRSCIDLKQCTPLQIEDAEQTDKTTASDAPSGDVVYLNARPQHNSGDDAAERPVDVEPAAPPQPVDDYRDMLLRRAHEAEAKGKSVIMREPKSEVRWPKPPEF